VALRQDASTLTPKNLVKKNRTTNFLRQAIRESIFLWLIVIQLLKAVAMGVVAKCGTCTFLPDRHNPAIPAKGPHTRIKPLDLASGYGRYVTISPGRTFFPVS
jgi:hypothetical protein